MRLATEMLGTLLAILLFTQPLAKAEGAKTAAELIDQAHKHDNMYTLGPEASQQKALGFYRSALAAGPDDKERLHILYRMAQLYGSAYQLEKGEKPNYRKAISLYKEIINSYPSDEPLVCRAMIAIGDHHTTLWEFESAVEWFKKALEHDLAEMGERAEALQLDGQEEEASYLNDSIKTIKRYQEIAVDQVVYSAGFIDPLRVHGELRSIVSQYAGTFIGDKASDRLRENMDKMADLWAPQQDDAAPFDSDSHLRAAGTANVEIGPSVDAVGTQSDVPSVVTEHHRSSEPNTIGLSPQDDYVTEARAPPAKYLSGCILGAAGLVVLSFAAARIRSKNHSKELAK